MASIDSGQSDGGVHVVRGQCHVGGVLVPVLVDECAAADARFNCRPLPVFRRKPTSTSVQSRARITSDAATPSRTRTMVLIGIRSGPMQFLYPPYMYCSRELVHLPHGVKKSQRHACGTAAQRHSGLAWFCGRFCGRTSARGFFMMVLSKMTGSSAQQTQARRSKRSASMTSSLDQCGGARQSIAWHRTLCT